MKKVEWVVLPNRHGLLKAIGSFQKLCEELWRGTIGKSLWLPYDTPWKEDPTTAGN